MQIYEEDGKLVIQPSGSIRSDNAAELETEIRKAAAEHPRLPLVIDARGITYISSSGLRVLLALQKEPPKAPVIRNVTPEVYDIFEVTGFNTLMDIRKKMREISVNNCRVIGRGAIGTVYRYDGDTIVKVYKGGEEMIPVIRAERERARKAFLLGIPTAIPFDTVKAGDCYGAMFEMVNAENLNKQVIRDPEQIPGIIHRYVELLKSIHALEAAPGDLPDARRVFVTVAERMAGDIGKRNAGRVIKMLEAMPENRHILHGDAHLMNVMDSNGTLMMIDMDTLSTGDPVFEFGALYTSYISFSEDDPGNTLKFHGLSEETCTRIFSETLREYLGNPDEEAIKKARQKIALLDCLRFIDVLDKEFPDDALRKLRYRHTAEHIAELLPQIDSLTL